MKYVRFEGKVHAFPDDFTGADIGKALASVAAVPKAKMPLGRVPIPLMTGINGPVPFLTGEQMTSILPGAGSMAGAGIGALAGMGPLSPPAAMGLSGLGGAGGEAIRLALNKAMGLPVPSSLGGIAGDIALQGGIGAASEGAGQLIHGLAGPIMQATLRTGSSQAARTVLDEGIVGNTRGVAKLVGKRQLAADVTNSLVDNATNRLQAASEMQIRPNKGTYYGTQQLISDMKQKLAPQINKLADPTEARAFYTQKMRNFKSANRGQITATQLHEFKKSSDLIADPIYAALKKQEQVGANELLNAHWNKALADVARDRLNPVGAVSGATAQIGKSGKLLSRYEASNQVTGKLANAETVLKKAVLNKPGPLAQGLMRGGGAFGGGLVGAMMPGPAPRWEKIAGGAAAMAALTNPTIGSLLAHTANNPIVAGIPANTLRLLMLALAQQSPTDTTEAP